MPFILIDLCSKIVFHGFTNLQAAKAEFTVFYIILTVQAPVATGYESFMMLATDERWMGLIYMI